MIEGGGYASLQAISLVRNLQHLKTSVDRRLQCFGWRVADVVLSAALASLSRRRRAAADAHASRGGGGPPAAVSTIVGLTGILPVRAPTRLSKIAGRGFTPGRAVAPVGAPSRFIAFTM